MDEIIKPPSVELSYKHISNRNYGKIPKESNKEIEALAAPHVESFNYFLEEGLTALLQDFDPVEFTINDKDRYSLMISDLKLKKPEAPTTGKNADRNLYPKECIERGCSYSAPLTCTVSCTFNDQLMLPLSNTLGDVPILVKSKKCHLHGLNPKQLVEKGFLVNETGGYFIINGSCKVMRMLVANRSNYPLAIQRDSWKKRLDGLTEKGIMMRCERGDQTHSLNILHYVNTGEAKLQIVLEGQGFFVPLIMMLKALRNLTDFQIYTCLVRGREEDKYFKEKVKNMLRSLQSEGLYNRDMCRKYIAKSFRFKLLNIFPNWLTDDEICEQLLRRCLLIHIRKDEEKFDTLCMMARKLFAFIADDAKVESSDTVAMQQVTLGGHTFLQYMRELLVENLLTVKYQIMKMAKTKPGWQISDKDFKDFVNKAKKPGPNLQYLVATGTLRSKSGCGLMQTTGLSILMEHLNRMRDLSHLRSIHRGAYFQDMKTLGPRRLTGEAWGFICPVHTPDGAPCGLLNHLTQDCLVVNEVHKNNDRLRSTLFHLGMLKIDGKVPISYDKCLEVMLDGVFIGYLPTCNAEVFTHDLRLRKTRNEIFKFTEIVLIKKRKYGGQYPGLYLATSIGRMMRPVINLSTKSIEYIGTLEQNYLNVAVSPEEIEEGVHTHVEKCKTTILSNVAKLVPFSDCNPCPRNMYQCQMGKQTMGTPFHNFISQTTSKSYRLQYPQVPLVRNSHYDDINMEEFCMGFNAVVAIVSYTGYDMEDAMVLNKGAMERGLAHGQIYKSEFIDLSQSRLVISSAPTMYFRRNPEDTVVKEFLDDYGLPYPGTKLKEGDPYYSTYNIQTQAFKLVKYKGEDCVVDKYTIMGSTTSKLDFQRVNITIRIARHPNIGDKFASRAGQKGIMSRLYPSEDLPFSERGIIPDILFNPHGIPSRMTAGVLLELIGGKAAAEFGKSFNTSPFQFSDEDPAVDYFGKILEKGGFNYYGEDTLYSGTDGRMMETKIFKGIIYYQRLRHMTADKWQVRQTGAMDNITRQPIKGRKKGGAIRFGEMERDCLIAHGAPYTLQDRLLKCSDKFEEWVCGQCQESLSPIMKLQEGNFHIRSRQPICSLCGPESKVFKVTMPYAFKYLVAELASIGISTKFGLQTSEKKISRPQVVAVERESA